MLPVQSLAVEHGVTEGRDQLVEAGFEVGLDAGVKVKRGDRDRVDLVDGRGYLVELGEVGVQVALEEVDDAVQVLHVEQQIREAVAGVAGHLAVVGEFPI